MKFHLYDREKCYNIIIMAVRSLSLALLIMISGSIYSQKSIIDSFQLSPRNPLINDNIIFLVYYNSVPGITKPVAEVQQLNDTILIVSNINSTSGCCLKNHIDTIEIGYLNAGQYVLIHRLNDWGKVGYLGTDTTFTFVIDYVSLLANDYSENFVVYPNPTNGKINILMNQAIEKGQSIKILNSIGQQLTTKKPTMINDETVTFDLSGYAKGLYILIIKDLDHQTNIKLIKE
jgi:Secretion system C-terminal sorting domain